MARGDMAARMRAGVGSQEPSPLHPPAQAVPLGGADVHAQIAAARAAPRSAATFRRRVDDLLDLAGDDLTGLIWVREQEGKMVRGASIRLAELLQYGWGNLRSIAQTTMIGRDYVEAEGVCLDVETNSATSIAVRRSTRRPGARPSHEAVLSIATAAGSVARRNAIMAAIPQIAWAPVLAKVEARIAGDEETLSERRDILLADLCARGVSTERVCLALGVDAPENIDRALLVTLYGLTASVRDGAEDADDIFPDPSAEPPPIPSEGFSLPHVARELGTPLAAVADSTPTAAQAPDEAQPQVAEQAAPPSLAADPVDDWMAAWRGDLAEAKSVAALERMADALPERLDAGFGMSPSLTLGLSLSARGALTKRRKELEAEATSARDETVDLFESVEG